jgi:hypothetical protein
LVSPEVLPEIGEIPGSKYGSMRVISVAVGSYIFKICPAENKFKIGLKDY